MKVHIGAVYLNNSRNLVLLVLAKTNLSARCVVIWSNEAVTTAYRVGEVDSWSLELIELHWRRVN